MSNHLLYDSLAHFVRTILGAFFNWIVVYTPAFLLAAID